MPHMRNTNMHGKISAKTERLAVQGCYHYYSAVSVSNKPKYIAGNHLLLLHHLLLCHGLARTTHVQKLIFERINLVCLSSFAFGMVCSCLPWGSKILLLILKES